MDNRILEHLKRLNQYLVSLKEIAAEEKEKFAEDNILIPATERYLQLAIETCINIGNRILSLEQFNTPVKTPESYADIFKELAKIGFIEHDFSKKLIHMAKFRNRLVHLYWHIDSEEVYKILQNDLPDLEKFMKLTSNYLKKD